MNSQKIDQRRLSEKVGADVCCFSEIDSTSLYVKRLILQNVAPAFLTIAEAQTNGQGRVGKSFYSPAGTGLYMTFAFSSDQILCDDLTPRVAIAVSRAIEAVFGVACKVKWVNDIYAKNKKVCGILVQKTEGYILIGIGINVEAPKEIPAELINRFGSVCDTCDAHQYEELVSEINSKMKDSFLLSKTDILSEYRLRCIHIGNEVVLEHNGDALSGKCVGISDDFLLRVEQNGVISEYSSGYMTLKIEI